jgi:hypothetical protein
MKGIAAEIEKRRRERWAHFMCKPECRCANEYSVAFADLQALLNTEPEPETLLEQVVELYAVMHGLLPCLAKNCPSEPMRVLCAVSLAQVEAINGHSGGMKVRSLSTGEVIGHANLHS